MTVIHDGLQVPGLNFYGLLYPDDELKIKFPGQVWPDAKYSEFVLWGDGWRVVNWEVAVSVWPTGESFRKAVRETFKVLRQAGSVVTWIGAEGYFCDPPDLFSPDCMSGGVLAAATADGREWLSLDADEPVSPLSDEVLQELKQASPGLSDAGSH